MVIEKHDEEDFGFMRDERLKTEMMRGLLDNAVRECYGPDDNMTTRSANMVYDPDKGCVRGPRDRDDGDVCGGQGADREFPKIRPTRTPMKTWLIKISEDWTPTEENIRELPDPVRAYLEGLRRVAYDEYAEPAECAELRPGPVQEVAEDWPLGWSADRLHRTIAEIESECEFSILGPARSFFEIPPGNRFVYRVYAYVASAPDEALEAVKHQVLALIRGEPEGRDVGPTYDTDETLPGIFWRNPEKIRLKQRHDGRWEARTRLVTTRDAG